MVCRKSGQLRLVITLRSASRESVLLAVSPFLRAILLDTKPLIFSVISYNPQDVNLVSDSLVIFLKKLICGDLDCVTLTDPCSLVRKTLSCSAHQRRFKIYFLQFAGP